MKIKSKLPGGGTNIFTIMSRLATEHKAINLGQGFPNFNLDQKLLDLVTKYLNQGKNQYCPMPGLPALNKALTRKIKKLYNTELDPTSEITITAGATQALYTAITAFVHPGDEVVIIEPAYDCYKPAIELVGGKVVPYILRGPDFRVDWDEFETLLTDRTRMVMINTPHNPIGKALKAEDIQKLEALLKDRDIILISDEVYEHIIFDGLQHESILKYPELLKKALCIFSFGKTFHGTGWKIGYAAGPEYLMKEFRKVHQWNVFCVNSFLQYALAEYIEDENNYLSLANFYQAKRDFLSTAMKGSKLKSKGCEGSYFQLYDYAQISDEKDTDFAIRLTKEYGVASIPISVFYSHPQYDKVVRLCFAKTEDMLSAAAERLTKI